MVEAKHPGATNSATIKFSSIFEQLDLSQRKTKIICTLGPACWDTECLVKMLDAGMNVARLNFSHGDHESHGGSVDRLREALKQRPDKVCAVMLDTKGPEIRTGMVKGGTVTFVKDQILEITTDFDFEGDSSKIACSYQALPTSVQVGSTIFIADGSLTCEVCEILEAGVKVNVKNNATIGNRKNMNLPGAIVDLPTLTEKDEDDLVEFGLKKGVDMIAASFVRKAEDVENIRDVLGPRGAHVKIIAKIENQAGLNNFDEILATVDGIMVARGDLGMEIPPEKVFIAQKWMIEKCNIAAKPVQTATQMLESMITAPRPTRAEASDVANAVLDGSDCVMLSGESANGAYPVAAVTVMARTCCEAERCIDYKQSYNDMKMYTTAPLGTNEAIASSAVQAVMDLGLDAIVCLTDTGLIARLAAKYRAPVPVLACSKHGHVIRNLQSTRGVFGHQIAAYNNQNEAIKSAVEAAKALGLVKAGGKVACLVAENEETPDESNVMKVVNVE